MTKLPLGTCTRTLLEFRTFGALIFGKSGDTFFWIRASSTSALKVLSMTMAKVPVNQPWYKTITRTCVQHTKSVVHAIKTEQVWNVFITYWPRKKTTYTVFTGSPFNDFH